MWYLMEEIFLCLIIAGILGFFMGWLLKGQFCKTSGENDSPPEEKHPFTGSVSSSGHDSFRRESFRDDLKAIKGIGGVIEKILNEMGIFTYRQIASFSQEDMERIARELGVFTDRIQRDNWVEQARDLHFRKYGERI